MERGRDPRLSDLPPRLLSQDGAGLVHGVIGVSLPDRREGAADPFGQEPLTQGPESIDHPRIAGVTAEEDEAAPVAIDDALVVDEGAAQLQQPLQQRHVGLLPLDDVGEAEVGVLREELGRRHLLDPEDDRDAAEVPLNLGPRRLILLVVEDAVRRRLHHRTDASASELLHVPRCQRCAPLPAVLVLASDGNSQHCASSDPPGSDAPGPDAPGPDAPGKTPSLAPAPAGPPRPLSCSPRRTQGCPPLPLSFANPFANPPLMEYTSLAQEIMTSVSRIFRDPMKIGAVP